MEVGVERLWVSGTSSMPSPSAMASTAQIPPAQIVSNSKRPKDSTGSSASNNDASWFEKWGLYFTIIALPIAGIIGYFSGVIALKDAIADNKAAVLVLQTDIAYLKASLQEETKSVTELKNDLNTMKNQNNASPVISKK